MSKDCKAKEIGGYFEFEQFYGQEYHSRGLSLNCGRNALVFLIKGFGIKKIALPYYLCDSVTDVCEKYNVSVRYYHINDRLIPVDNESCPEEYFYLVNYYGQIKEEYISELYKKYGDKLIIDNTQNFFAIPNLDVNTIYTCRKYFGVSDGAYLFPSKNKNDKISKEYENLPVDKSLMKMKHLLGRFESGAEEFYLEYTKNENSFADASIKKMSKITKNLLKGIDYERIKRKRTENFNYLHYWLSKYNELNIQSIEGPFMYPLLLNRGNELRKKLIAKKIFCPMLWPEVCDKCPKNTIEYNLTHNLILLPIDQRYGKSEMEYVVKIINEVESLGIY